MPTLFPHLWFNSGPRKSDRLLGPTYDSPSERRRPNNMQTVLLTDIDNTLYDWPSFFAPSFRAMINVLSRELAIAEETLYDECRKVFAQYQSLEYPFYIQELESVKTADIERRRHLIKSGRGAFNSVKKKWLQPYPGVVDTLKWLNYQGVLVVAVSNAPVYLSQQRLWELKLDTWLDGLVGWEGLGSLWRRSCEPRIR